MKVICTSLAALVLFATSAFAGNVLAPTPRPEIVQPVAASCAHVPIISDRTGKVLYFNVPVGCPTIGNEINDVDRVGFGFDEVADMQETDECGYDPH